jgi:hypothetical protein
MFYRLREFAEGIGSLPTAGFGLLVGSAVGALVTVQATGGTPYSQHDLDRVAAHGRAAAAAAPVETTAARGQSARLDRLRQKNERLAGELSAAHSTIADLQDQLDTAASAAAAASASPSTSAAESSGGSSVGSSGVAPSASATPSNGAAGLKVTGTLDVSWVLSSALKPWPSSCSEIGSGYRVRVNTGDQTVTLGVPTSFRSTGRSTKGGILSVSCDVTWSATLPAPMANVYEFVAVDASSPEKPLDTTLAQASDLVGGKVPPLGVSFCPECHSTQG